MPRRFAVLPNLRHLGPYLGRYRRDLTVGYLHLLAKTACELTIPWLLKRGIDQVAAGASAGTLVHTAGWILLASAGAGIFMYNMRWAIIGASRKIEYDLRNDFFGHLVGLSLPFFQRNRTGDLMARATNDLNAVRDVVGPGVMYALGTATSVIASVVLMARIDWLLTVAVLIPFPIMAFLVARFSQEVHRRSLVVQDEYGRLQNSAQENLAGIRVVQSNTQEEAELLHFEERSQAYVQANVALIRYRALFFATVAAVVGTGALVLLWVGGARTIGGQMTLGEIVAFMAYLSQLTWPFIATGWVASLVQRGEAAMQRMREIWEVRPEVPSGEIAPPRPIRGELRFEGVSFTYADGTEALRAIDLEVPAGSTVAVVGRTGSGKSSLVSLIPRLQDPSRGVVRLDGRDLRELDLRALRAAIGVVPQDGFLFSDTLANNIRFGNDQATDEEVERVVRMAGLEDEVRSFPRGLRTRVGERGITLSGGQRQRTALARALLKDPEVLILDDALAAVDKETEANLLETLRQIGRSRTLVIIAHRISTVRDADQIVVLDHGRILERGTHTDLLARRGTYAEMARQQELAEQLEATDVGG
ncbi:MAG: ABC transporter ATP-binding protein [Candidatus Eisenbacteria bacterium]|nr:ABC transporter ATP-binding protein [Candidatus Eisenbacteria bacterium]MCC7142424.1 ABC transporter ATP-binding protein [Candidatus Eisenbacteria bacterium]